MSMIGRIADSPFTLPALVVAALGLLAALLLPGCNDTAVVEPSPPPRPARMAEVSFQHVSAARILVLRDRETGREYLVVIDGMGVAACPMSEGEDDGELAAGND